MGEINENDPFIKYVRLIFNNDVNDETIKQFVEINKNSLNIHRLILMNSKSSRIELTKWLYQNFTAYKTTYIESFDEACKSNNLDFVKYYLSTYTFSLKEITSGFEWACYNDKLETVRYLYDSYSIDIERDHHKIFMYSCLFRNIKVAQWFTTIYPNYLLIMDGNKILRYGVKTIYHEIIDYYSENNLNKIVELF
jgi:hypothetical protein